MARRYLLNRLKSPFALLVFAVALAAFVAYLAYLYLQQREARIKQDLAETSSKRQTPKVSVVVPRTDARVGVVVGSDLFVTRDIDQDLIYPDTVLATDFANVRGQRLARPVLHGRPLRVTDLTVPEVRDVASVLPVGSRAVTIEIDNVNSIAQTLRPGHHVDVFLLSMAPAARAAGAEAPPEGAANQATLYMQDLAVIATGQQFLDVTAPNSEDIAKMARPGEIEGQRDKGFDTVTVLVSPAQAARLLVGQKLGSFRVALRGTKDDRAVALQPLTGRDVLPMPKTASNAREGVEFIVGGRSGGNAALPPTLVSLGLPNVGGPAGTNLPANAASLPIATTSATAPTGPVETRAMVEDVIKSLTRPHSNVDRTTRAATNPSPSAP